MKCLKLDFHYARRTCASTEWYIETTWGKILPFYTAWKMGYFKLIRSTATEHKTHFIRYVIPTRPQYIKHFIRVRRTSRANQYEYKYTVEQMWELFSEDIPVYNKVIIP
jgi:hypothetical protein